MTERHNTPAGFAGLIQLWTSQLRQITEGLAGTAGSATPSCRRPCRRCRACRTPAPCPRRS